MRAGPRRGGVRLALGGADRGARAAGGGRGARLRQPLPGRRGAGELTRAGKRPPGRDVTSRRVDRRSFWGVHPSMSPLTRAFGLVVSVLLAALSGCTSDNVPAGQCRYDSDCDSPQVCVGTFCRAACATDRDCPDNGICARSLGGVQICAARDAPRPCLYSSDCPATTFCTRDGICQSRCRGDYDCQVINPFNSCVEGSCQLVCPANFADCDGDVRNGCEVDTRTSAQHCGRCANACSGADGAPGVCRAGACVAPCATGFADCDGAAANGCEADLSQSDHCGSCATRCSGERALCLAVADPGTGARTYSCQASCPEGTTTCGTRCSDLQSDPAHCGGCDRACPSGAGATADLRGGPLRAALRRARGAGRLRRDGRQRLRGRAPSQPHALRRLRQRLPARRPRHPGVRRRRLPALVRSGVGQLRRRRGQRLRDRPDGHRRPLRDVRQRLRPTAQRVERVRGRGLRGGLRPGLRRLRRRRGQRLRGEHHRQRRALRRLRAGVRGPGPTPRRPAPRAPASTAAGRASSTATATRPTAARSTPRPAPRTAAAAAGRAAPPTALRRAARAPAASPARRASATATATRPTAARPTPPATPSTAGRAGRCAASPVRGRAATGAPACAPPAAQGSATVTA